MTRPTIRSSHDQLPRVDDLRAQRAPRAKRTPSTQPSRRSPLASLPPIALALTTTLLALTLASCAADPSDGYSFESTFSPTVRTVSVPIFENATFAVGVETELTEAIIAEIKRVTPWAVIAERPGGGGDTTLSGVVRDVKLERLSTARGSGLVEEQILSVSVDFDWRDNRTGDLLLSRRKFAAGGSFVPARPTAQRIDAGRREAVQQLARDIVNELRASW